MSKRANPFLEDYVPQSKVHFGIKQYNNNEDRLKKVYEKTLELLFKGAKKLPCQESVNHILEPLKKDKFKQLLIGKNGALELSGAIIVGNGPNLLCKNCTDMQTDLSCAFCELKLCAACQHPCVRCERVYCSRCSLVGSEEEEVCVSCYSK